ncbi:MAG: hypothetical protein JWO48_615 [Bryobacterales bacterium]|nr:hypothetical protein [Bryobacterales bacterium]
MSAAFITSTAACLKVTAINAHSPACRRHSSRHGKTRERPHSWTLYFEIAGAIFVDRVNV